MLVADPTKLRLLERRRDDPLAAEAGARRGENRQVPVRAVCAVELRALDRGRNCTIVLRCRADPYSSRSARGPGKQSPLRTHSSLTRSVRNTTDPYSSRSARGPGKGAIALANSLQPHAEREEYEATPPEREPVSGKQQILTIEDDAAIRRGIVDALRFAGYETLEAARGDEGLEMALGCQFDLLLLDLVLPRRDGLEILREVRRLRPTLPVIILTARGEEADRVRGLRDGADDYVVKPFSVKELLARVEAVLAPHARAAQRRSAGCHPRRRDRPGPPRGAVRRRRARGAFRARGRAGPLPGGQLRPGHLPRGDPGQRLADQPPRAHHADHRHARRPAAGEAPRRPGRARRSC